MFLTPLYKSHNLFSKINLFIKQDDLFPFPGGGSKARKLKYILNDHVVSKYNAIVTAGGNQSNHLRSTALCGAMLGWKTISIIHDTKPSKFDGNLKLTQLAGSECRFVEMAEVKKAMDNAMEDLRNEGYNPLYIWGGGHCIEGSLAYYEATKELKTQLNGIIPDYIFVASGTGTTQAGIEIGIRQFFPHCKVIGISVARERSRGSEKIIESMHELNDYLNTPVSNFENLIFDDNFVGKGYQDTYPELLETIKWAAKTEGLILDPTYTGKAFHALSEYVKNRTIHPNANVVFWHTGGLLNLMASNQL